MLVVPTTAVLYDDDNLPFVYVQVEPGKFAQRLVKIGGQQGDDTQIVERAQGRRCRRVPGQRVPAVREYVSDSK